MKNNLRNLLLMSSLSLASGLLAVNAEAQSLQPAKSSIKAVVKAMTLEEKAFFVVGTGMDFPVQTEEKSVNPAPVVGNTLNLVPGAAGTSYTVARLGITPMVLADGPAGLRILPNRENDSKTYYCTAFPVATLLASTWDTELVYNVGKAMGNEVLEYGADVLLAPAINIHRNPLCGRNFEYYSEDPMLTGFMAAAMINGVQSQGVGTSLKHFAANNAETSRNNSNSIMSQRALREIYLEGFRIAVQQSQPWTVMTSYNLLNGVYTSENYDLVTKILRNEWGFKGFVMTDWYGGKDAIAQMKAGNDMIMPGMPSLAQKIVAAVKSGALDVKILDKNVERILNVLVTTPGFNKYSFSNTPDLKAHALVTRQAAADGIILLKNNNDALPFGSNVKSIAAFGNASYETISGGTGSGDVNEAYTVSIYDGLVNAGLNVQPTLKQQYIEYLKDEKAKQPKQTDPMMALLMPPPPVAPMTVELLSARLLAAETDAAVITIGRNAGEGGDRKNIEGDFLLSATEQDMIERVCNAYHAAGKKVVVILNVGGVVETVSWRGKPDAILLAWQGGQETGNSIADILIGKVNPSGKLASTFPARYEDVPSAATFPGKILGQTEDKELKTKEDLMALFFNPKPAEVTYEDGIYVGYRYFATFGVKPAYEFGFGLSYTEFTYSDLAISSPVFKGKQTITFVVTNKGKTAGREVVQLYIKAPASAIDKPQKELKGFAKTRLLQPGESQTITLTLAARDLSSFNTAESAWVADAGKYMVEVGASSENIRLTGEFTMKSRIVTEKVNKVLAPAVQINELKNKQ